MQCIVFAGGITVSRVTCNVYIYHICICYIYILELVSIASITRVSRVSRAVIITILISINLGSFYNREKRLSIVHVPTISSWLCFPTENSCSLAPTPGSLKASKSQGQRQHGPDQEWKRRSLFLCLAIWWLLNVGSYGGFHQLGYPQIDYLQITN